MAATESSTNTVTIYEDGGGFLWMDLMSEDDILRDVTFAQDPPGKGIHDMFDAVQDGTDGWNTDTLSLADIVADAGSWDAWLQTRGARQIACLEVFKGGTMVLTIEPIDRIGAAGRRYLGLEAN